MKTTLMLSLICIAACYTRPAAIQAPITKTIITTSSFRCESITTDSASYTTCHTTPKAIPPPNADMTIGPITFPRQLDEDVYDDAGVYIPPPIKERVW